MITEYLTVPVARFIAKIPVYSEMQPDPEPNAGKWWMNLVFPSLNATLHLSYKRNNRR